MATERGRMRNDTDNQSSGKATGKIDRKTAAAASTFQRGDEYPYDSDFDTAYHFPYFVLDGLEDHITRLEARLADVRALRAASAVEYYDYLQSPGMIPGFPDEFGQMPTFTWTVHSRLWEYIPDCDKSTVQVQPSVQSSSNFSRDTTRY